MFDKIRCVSVNFYIFNLLMRTLCDANHKVKEHASHQHSINIHRCLSVHYPANADVFPAVACLRRRQATAGNTSAFAGYQSTDINKLTVPLTFKLDE